jgi:cytochrome c peroxidase
MVAAFVLVTLRTTGQQGPPVIPNNAAFSDPTGTVSTFNVNGSIDLTNPFFQSLGTNGRSCGTCHQPSDGMSVSAAHVQARFNASGGTDPIFRTNDGSTCNNNTDYSLLTSRGLIRIAIAVPAGADFYVQSVSNPYGCGDTGTLSMYRRPLPATNLNFLSTMMWDGRESSSQTGTTPINSSNYPQSLLNDLAHQSVDATLGHAQAAQAPTADQQQQIVALETGLYTAQATDNAAGQLYAQGAAGGAQNLQPQPFYIGINDPVGLNPTGTSFTPAIFNVFDVWTNLNSNNAATAARASIGRGQTVFNSKPITISGVAGLNGVTFSSGVTVPASFTGACGTCHDTPNAGNHSVSAPLNIGIADVSNSLGVGYLPQITICPNAGGSCVTTTDPGRALITGKFADTGKFKGPILRGLASRAPYFHNGSALSLTDAVIFYNVRFGIGFTAQEISDLVMFLNSL